MNTIKRLAQNAMAALTALLSLLAGGQNLNASQRNVNPSTPMKKLVDPKDPGKNASKKSANSGGSGNKPLGDRILDAIPDGTTVEYDDLVNNAGQDVADVVGWAKPKKITRKGSRLIVECEPGASISNGSVTVNLDKQVEFDVSSVGDTVTLSNIKGVKVSAAGISLMTVDKVTIKRNSDGTITISGKGVISRWLPSVPINVTVDPKNL